jgi:hypothetical protein
MKVMELVGCYLGIWWPANVDRWTQVMARVVVCLTPRKPAMNLDKSFGSFAGGIQGARQIQYLPMMLYCASCSQDR